MLRYLIFALSIASANVHAMTSLRVDNKVLTIGDSAAYVLELMGEPTIRVFLPWQASPRHQRVPGEQWQYAQDGKTIVITFFGGRATQFETLYP